MRPKREHPQITPEELIDEGFVFLDEDYDSIPELPIIVTRRQED
jgi:hypothetical protein